MLCVSPSGLMRRDEFLGGNASLAQHARQRAGLQFTVHRDYAPHRTPTHYDVTASLPRHDKAEPLQRANRISPG